MIKNINFNIVRAIGKRDLRMYFSNPSGYVFITLFIFLSAAAAFWQDRFFLNNLANLDQLNLVFPYLLMFFVPALTMSVWAEERKLGTDELLLTLPATDVEVVLGKYLATLAVYTAALALSLSHVIVLLWLGSPDIGLMFANYGGYWLLGAAMIALGILASLLTANVTIAFIVGALFCGLLVLIQPLGDVLSESLGRLLAPVGVIRHFQDFGRGVVSLASLMYFGCIAGFFLYLNVLVVGKRHWPLESEGMKMTNHQLIRGVSIAVIIVSSITLVGRLGFRIDTTAERLHSLTRETRNLLSEIPDDRPVFVQGFISPTVPEQFVQTRANVLALLREISAASSGNVKLLIKDTVPFSEEAREAREKFGIEPRQVPNLGGARAGFSDVFLGLAFTSGGSEQVISFFDQGLPAEYELARSIRVVANTNRRRIGVINTQLRLFGGLDFNTMQSTPAWSVVGELKKQYEVVQIAPRSEITETVDGILVALPSSLTQGEMDNVLSFIRKGTPAVLLLDPLPIVNLGLAPSEQPGAGQNPFMRQGQPPPEPKGNIRAFLEELGVRWDPSLIVWDAYNPHPDLAHLPPEVVFLGEGNQNPNVFNMDSAASAGIQQLVFLYPGHLDTIDREGGTFLPLLSSGQMSGGFPYSQMVQRNFLGAGLNQNLPHRPDPMNYTLAVYSEFQSASPDSQEEENESSDSTGSIKVIAIADLDFISEQFFHIRRIGPPNLNFDNVSFFLNSMDVLIGDESFVALRKRRVRHRTLERVEDQTRQFIEQRTIEEEEAEQKAQQELDAAQQRLNGRVAEVEQRDDLDRQAKQIMARNLQEVENRRFEVLKTNIEAEKETEIRASQERMESQIRRIQSGIRTAAVILPPIPVFLLGVYIFVKRQQRERESTDAARRLREE